MSEQWDVIPVPDLNLLKYEKDGWVIECSWPQRGKSGEVQVNMRIQNLGIGGGTVMSKRRINIRSSTATNGILTLVNRTLPDTEAKAKWQMDFQRVLENIESWYERDKEVERPDPTKAQEKVPWLYYPIWPAHSVTGIAAAPGSMKSYIALTIALSLSHGTPLLQRNTGPIREQKRILYLDWEDRPDEFARRLRAVQQGNGLPVEAVLDYKQLSVSMDDAAEGITEVVRRDKYDGVIVDSMSASIDGGMNDDQAVNAFWSSIYRTGVPALVLAHKSIHHQQQRTPRFFGSGMSEARVRMAWNAETTEDRGFVVWDCFKDNSHGLLGSKLAWAVEFESEGERDDRSLKKVSFMGVNPESVLFETSGGAGEGGLSRTDEIRRLLTVEGPMTRKEIISALNTTESAVVSAMKADRGGGFVRLDDGRWSAGQ